MNCIPESTPKGPTVLSLLDSSARRVAARWLGLVAVAFATSATAAPAINTLEGGLFGGHGGPAILGYDPVAYFTDGKPVKGRDDVAADWMGATWKFASAAHRDLFKSDPRKYAPQYGGYCAYGVSQGNLVGIEPDKFRIIDGKLYLNYNASVQTTWLTDPAGYIKQADAKFAALLNK
jgi:YHS domain-containing protein